MGDARFQEDSKWYSKCGTRRRWIKLPRTGQNIPSLLSPLRKRRAGKRYRICWWLCERKWVRKGQLVGDCHNAATAVNSQAEYRNYLPSLLSSGAEPGLDSSSEVDKVESSFIPCSSRSTSSSDWMTWRRARSSSETAAFPGRSTRIASIPAASAASSSFTLSLRKRISFGDIYSQSTKIPLSCQWGLTYLLHCGCNLSVTLRIGLWACVRSIKPICDQILQVFYSGNNL